MGIRDRFKGWLETPSEKKARRRRNAGRVFRLGGALVVGVLLLILAVKNAWPFNHPAPGAPPRNPTLWQYLLEDRFTLGLARLALSAGAIYGVLSVLGLIAQNRWLRNFLGLKVDDPGTVKDLKAKLDQTIDQRDEALAALQDAKDQLGEALDRVATLEKKLEGGDGNDS